MINSTIAIGKAHKVRRSFFVFNQRSHGNNACGVASFEARHSMIYPHISDIEKFRSLPQQFFAIVGRTLTIIKIFRNPFDGTSVALAKGWFNREIGLWKGVAHGYAKKASRTDGFFRAIG
jgi:hypothetical protein